MSRDKFFIILFCAFLGALLTFLPLLRSGSMSDQKKNEPPGNSKKVEMKYPSCVGCKIE